MPPSPTMRLSPGRELKTDNCKRGHKGGIFFREKDEDLALFDELQSSETDNFLLQSDDNLEDMFATKLSYFSEHKLGIYVPVQGESSDILNAEEEKNDYDWLITPPDTPLFTSLDDETAPLDLAQRGRPRSLPISISGSSTIEKSRRSSKGSASPSRLSSSPWSGNSTVQKRGRPSLTPQSSPTPSSLYATPSRRLSSPPGEPSPSSPRSSTQTPRSLSTSCIGGSGGTSPVNTSRGNSASPKIRAWQSNIPGFSLEVPPNLCTSLADRPASFVRRSSPASYNDRDSSTRSSRQSMSPTASRSVSSSHSHIQDHFSPQTKHSAVSSDNCDTESLLSISAGTSYRSSARRVSSLPNNRAPTFSKKLPLTGAYNSTSKRSLDSELRQMDQRKIPQNMFRPLLSNVPSSTFYAGKASAVPHAIISGNSVTASSTTSSDPATSGTNYTEAIKQNQEDTSHACVDAQYLDAQDEVFAFDKAIEQNQEDTSHACVDTPYPDAQDEVFAFVKDDPLNENIVHETQDVSLSSHNGEFDGGGMTDCDIQAGSENQSEHDTAMSTVANSEAFDVKAAAFEVDGREDLVLCSNCGQLYCSSKALEEDLTLCPDCRTDVPTINTNIATSTIVTENSSRVSTVALKHSKSIDAADSAIAEPKSSEVTGMVEPMTSQHENIVGESRTSYDESIWNFLSTDFLSRTLVKEGDPRHANQQVVGQPIASYCLPDSNTGGQQMQQRLENSTVKVDASGGAGISVLLSRSSSCKGAYLQSRSFTASSISYDDPSYVRDSAYSSRVSHGNGSLSASSSVDWGSCRQTNTRLQRQSSGRKYDFEIDKHDKGATHRRTRSSLSGISRHGFQPSALATGILECSDRSVSQVQSDTDVNLIATDELLLSSQNIGEDDACTFVEKKDNCGTVDVFSTESSSHVLNLHLELSPDTPISNSEGSISPDSGKYLANDRKNVGDVEASTIPVESSFIVEETVPSSFVEKVEVAEVTSQSLLEMKTETNINEGSTGAQSDDVSLDSKRSFDEDQEPRVSVTADKDRTTLFEESDISDQTNCAPEDKGGSKTKSITPEEVTDTILFCSSIIQKISYDAATIAIEKGIPALFDGSRPTITILGKKDLEKKDPHGRNTVKRTSKPQKAEQVETDLKPPNSSNDEESTDASKTRIVGASNIDDSNMKVPPKLESKCNCTVM